MNRFIRYFNQNKNKIIISVAIIAFIIIIIRIIDSLYAENTNKRNMENTITKDDHKPTTSVITGDNVSEDVTDKNKNEIDNFVNYCNNKEFDKAYGLLTEDCKAEFGNKIENFKKQYVEKVFNKDKTYNMELWLNEGNEYTYKVTFLENNLLSTGGQNLDNNIQDYITIINNNNENKININGFIKKEAINKSNSEANVDIKINSKKIYKNYEIYNLTIRNRNEKSIGLTDSKSGKNICIVDENNIEYGALLNDISMENLEVKPAFEKNIDIKFNKIFDKNKDVEKLLLKNVIIDYKKDTQESEIVKTEKVEIEIKIK